VEDDDEAGDVGYVVDILPNNVKLYNYLAFKILNSMRDREPANLLLGGRKKHSLTNLLLGVYNQPRKYSQCLAGPEWIESRFENRKPRILRGDGAS
jgi:hypothetical protein